MPAIACIAIAALVIALLIVSAVTYFAPYVGAGADAAPPDAVSASTILDRIATEGVLRTDSWQLEPSHRAPTVSYSPEQAHAAMQHHIACGMSWCGAKHDAYWTLVRAGKIRPDLRAAP